MEMRSWAATRPLVLHLETYPPHHVPSVTQLIGTHMSPKNPSSPCRQDTFVGAGWKECQGALNEPASLGRAVLWWTKPPL